jgi:hypothetical protein
MNEGRKNVKKVDTTSKLTQQIMWLNLILNFKSFYLPRQLCKLCPVAADDPFAELVVVHRWPDATLGLLQGQEKDRE